MFPQNLHFTSGHIYAIWTSIFKNMIKKRLALSFQLHFKVRGKKNVSENTKKNSDLFYNQVYLVFSMHRYF